MNTENQGRATARPEIMNGKKFWPSKDIAIQHVEACGGCRVMRWKAGFDKYMELRF